MSTERKVKETIDEIHVGLDGLAATFFKTIEEERIKEAQRQIDIATIAESLPKLGENMKRFLSHPRITTVMSMMGDLDTYGMQDGYTVKGLSLIKGSKKSSLAITAYGIEVITLTPGEARVERILIDSIQSARDSIAKLEKECGPLDPESILTRIDTIKVLIEKAVQSITDTKKE